MPQLTPNLQRRKRQVKVLNFRGVPVPGQSQSSQVLTVVRQYELCKLHIAKILIIYYFCVDVLIVTTKTK